MANENYFEEMEREDEKCLRRFNEYTKLFKGITANTKGSQIDYIAHDRKNRICHIEIKQRKDKYSDFEEFKKKIDNIFLETGKINALTKIMQSGYTLNEGELFINIFDDGDTIVIHNLNKQQDFKWMPNQKVYNPGLKKYEYEHRLGCYIKNAIIYQYNSELDNFKRIQ